MADRVVSVRLSADVSDFRRGMQQAEQDVSKLSTTTEKTSGGISKFAKGAAGALAGIGLVSFASDAIKASSDLQQSIGKASDIFGTNAKAVEDWSTTSATAFGLSQQAALEAASTFGDMFTQLGFSGDKAAGLSEQVVQLAGDLGAFNNLPTADVLDRIGGAFRGEYDALQKVIPNISAARVQTEAMAATGKTNADSLTAQEKATAVLAIVQKDGAKAQGNYAKTAGDAATQQQTVTAELENTKAAIGQSLLPVYQDLLGAFQTSLPVIEGIGTAVGKVAQFVGDLPAPAKTALLALAGFKVLSSTGTFTKIADGIAGMRTELTAMTTGASGLGKVSGLAKGVGSGLLGAFGGPVGIAIAGATAAVTYFVSKAEAAAQAAGKIQDEVNGIADTFKGGFSTQDTVDKVTDLVSAARDELTQLGIVPGQIVAAAQEGGNALQGLKERVVDALDIKELGTHLSSVGADFVDITASMTGKATDAVLAIVAKGGPALDQLKQDWTNAGRGAGEFDNAVNDVRNTLEQTDGAYKALSVSSRAVAEGSKKSTDAAKTEAEAQAASAAAASKVGVAYGDLQRGIDSAATSTTFWAPALERAKTAISDSWKPAGLLAAALDDVSSAASEADQSAQFLQMSLDKLAGKDIDAEQAARANAAAMREMVSAHRDVAQAKSDVAQKTDDLAAAQAKEVTTDYTSEQKARDVANAKRDLASANDAVKDASDRFKDSQDKAAQSAKQQTDAVFQTTLKTRGYDAAVTAATEKMRSQRAQFIQSARDAGYSQTAAEKLANAEGLIPANVRTTYQSNAYDEIQRASALHAQLTNIDGRVVHYTIQGTVVTTGSARGLQNAVAEGAIFMASGGLRQPQVTGQPILWGEAGPEAYIPLTNDSRRGRAIDLWHETGKALGVMKMAAGGTVSRAALAGIAPRSLGARESISVGALGEVSKYVKDLGSAAHDAAVDANEAASALRRATIARHDEIGAVKRSNRERLAEAEAAVKAAKSAKERTAAHAKLAEAERRNATALAKVTAEQNRKVDAAQKEAVATRSAASAANRKSEAEAQAYKASNVARIALIGLTRAADATDARLSGMRDRLANARNARGQLAGSVSSGLVSGLGGGLFGFQEQRLSEASLLNGAKYNLGLVRTAVSRLSRLAKVGLNSSILAQLADPSNSVALGTVSKFSAAGIKQLNSIYAQTTAFANHAGSIVAGSQFDKTISVLSSSVDALVRRQQSIDRAIGMLARGVDLKWNGQVMAKAVRQGEKELRRRGA